MPSRSSLSPELPDWLRLAIADAVILFGRMEQEITEISWLLNDSDLKQKLKSAGSPTTKNFMMILEIVEKGEAGLKLDALREGFLGLADDRNLIVHGSWHMLGGRPFVVWHKFLEDDESISGETFEQSRFQRFMMKAEHLLGTLRQFHLMLET